MSDKPEQCQYCRFYTQPLGGCFRFPPVFVGIGGTWPDGGSQPRWENPRVSAVDWCGEFQRKEEPT